MTFDIIQKFVESKQASGRAVNISFRKRTPVTGLFIKGKDYEEMKAKNFWRIVPEARITEWEKTNDVQLAKLFSGNDFTRLK